MKEQHISVVKELAWDRDDTYNIVEVQVFNFKTGDKVKVTIESVQLNKGAEK